MKTKINREKIHALLEFISKHNVQEINLTRVETRYFFDTTEQADKLDRSRILLQPAFAEGYTQTDSGNMVVVIIHRSKILGTDDIKWEDGYDGKSRDNSNHYNPFTRRLVEIFINKMGLELLLEKIAVELNQRFAVSKGQAKAILKKHMGFTLDSGTRSFLHDLRKKIRKYQVLVSEFQEYVLENEQPELVPVSFVNQIITRIRDGNIDEVLNGMNEDWIDIPDKDNISEYQSSLEVQRKSGANRKKLDKIEKRLMLQNQPRYEFLCQKCDETREFIQEDTVNTFIESPKHHDKPMIVRILSET